MENNQSKHTALLERWSNEKKYEEFFWDGPLNWDIWISQRPRILFLGKEAHSSWQLNADQPISGAFILNIARWNYAIKCIFENRDVIPNYPSNRNELLEVTNDNIADVAIVDIKKNNEDKKISNDGDIKNYAVSDADFLHKQIELIDPNIIICCSSAVEHSYALIQDEEDYKNLVTLSLHNNKECWIHNNRLIIDFYHPANSHTPGGPKQMFETLCKLLIDGQVFERFDWGRK